MKPLTLFANVPTASQYHTIIIIMDTKKLIQQSKKIKKKNYLWKEYNPLMSHVHTLATPEVGSTLHEQEMSCHSQSLLLYHCHKWAQLHHTVLRWCYLPVDWIEVAALALTKHDPSTCGIHLLHPLNNNDCLIWSLAQDYYNLQN